MRGVMSCGIESENKSLRLGFDAGADVVEDLVSVGEVFGSLVGARGVTLFDGHEGADEGREFVDAAFVLNLVVTSNLNFVAGGDEGQFGTNWNTHHAELEARTMRYNRLCWLRRGVRLRDDWLIVFVHRDDGIV